MNMDESFTLDEIEQSEIEQLAEIPNIDNITVCCCKGMCLRESGRNACPCKTVSQFCSSACHPDRTMCMNKQSVLGGNSDSDSESEEQHEGTTDISDNEEEQRSVRGRGGRRGGRRGTRGRQRSGRGRGQTRGRSRSPIGEGQPVRGQMRGQNRPTRRRGRGRGRGRLVAEDNSQQRVVDHEQQLQNMVGNLEMDVLRRLALELLRRQPAVFADLVNGEMAIQNPNEVAQPASGDPGPGEHSPDWCMCGQCQQMPTQVENKCCTRTKMDCITTTPLFQQLILDGNVLDIAMRYREDVLVLDNPRNNENFRHAAYRQYVLWQHGRLGQGNRRVVPSCCVLAIRSRYPSPNGIYKGFLPARLPN